MTTDLVEPVVQVHLLGAFYVTIPAWRIMREKSYGRVINTSSSMRTPIPCQALSTSAR